MLLEYSGRYLALIEWGASIKQLVLMALLANIFFPVGWQRSRAWPHFDWAFCSLSRS